jgi:hypothetical protein
VTDQAGQPGRPEKVGEMLDEKLAEQDQRADELELRVRQLEMIARARGLIPTVEGRAIDQ